MIVLLYFTNVLAALVLAIPFFGMIKTGFGNSMAINEMLNQFNFTIFSDFISNAGVVVKNIVSQTIWLSAFFLIISSFLTGGILRTFIKDHFTMSSFFSASGYHFLRFMGLNVFMIIIQIIIASMVYVPVFALTSKISAHIQTELPLFRIFFTGIGIHLFLLILFILVGDYAKYYLLLHDSNNIFKAFAKAVMFVFGHFFKAFSIFIVLMAIPLLIFYLYLNLDRDIGMSTAVSIILMFLIQQMFIVLRIWFRLWMHSSQFELYTEKVIQQQYEIQY